MPKENNKEKALTALLESSSITEAAQNCELSEKTFRRYLEDKDFSDEYASARRQIVESAVTGLQNAANEAVETLRRNLSCDNPQAEIRAAQLILDNVFGNAFKSPGMTLSKPFAGYAALPKHRLIQPALAMPF